MDEHKGCPVCHNTEYNECYVRSTGDAYLYSTKAGETALNVCTKCGCVYANTRDGVK